MGTQQPKILFFDVETCPVLAWIWRTGYNLTVTHEHIKAGQKFDIICVCWKWGHEKEVHALDWGIKKQDSTKMLEKFTKVVEEADIIVAHNGDKFDVRHINTQRLLHGQPPIAWPTSEDTLKQFRKYFWLPSFKLDYISKMLGAGGKDRMCFQDWIDIVEGHKQDALDKMIKYCKKDVRLLETAFNKASKFFKPKANVGLILGTGRYACPRCGNAHTHKYGIRTLVANQYQRRQCNKCGTVFIGETIKR